MTNRPRYWIDSETTGLGPARRPWEIALLGDHIEPQVFVVADVDLEDAEPEALAMNGIRDRHPLFGADERPGVTYVDEAQVVMHLSQLLAGAEWVGAQASFDAECIAAMFRRHEVEPNWHYRLREIESMTEGYLRRSVGGLQDCARALGVQVDPAVVHSALGDARLVQACWRVIHAS